MRNLFFLILFPFITFAQVDFELNLNEVLYDIEGATFLTTQTIGTKTYIRQYDDSYNPIWIDSIETLRHEGEGKVRARNLEKFGNSNEYLFRTTVDLDSISEGLYNNDSIRYQFHTVNLNTYDISPPYYDTIFGWYGYTLSINDSTIYFFKRDGSLGNSPNHLETYSISSDQNMQIVAPSDSMPYVFGYGPDLANHGDTIYYLENEFHFPRLLTYSLNEISLLNDTTVSFATDGVDWTQDIIPHLNHFQTHDSILSINTRDGGFWRFIWFNNQLDIYSDYEFPSPQIGYDFEATTVDQKNRLIYVLTNQNGSIGEWLFIYDFDFNLVCREYFVANTNNYDHELVNINDQVYVKSIENNQLSYYLVGCGLDVNKTYTKEDSFSIYPNPVSDQLKVSFNQSSLKKINITNLSGQIIFSEEINGADYNIDVSSFDSGIYFLTIDNEVRKFIVE